jgi:hypothetical protein
MRGFLACRCTPHAAGGISLDIYWLSSPWGDPFFSASLGPLLGSRTSVSSNSVTVITPGTASSISSTDDGFESEGAWRLHRPCSFPQNLLHPSAFGLSPDQTLSSCWLGDSALLAALWLPSPPYRLHSALRVLGRGNGASWLFLCSVDSSSILIAIGSLAGFLSALRQAAIQMCYRGWARFFAYFSG